MSLGDQSELLNLLQIPITQRRHIDIDDQIPRVAKVRKAGPTGTAKLAFYVAVRGFKGLEMLGGPWSPGEPLRREDEPGDRKVGGSTATGSTVIVQAFEVKGFAGSALEVLFCL